MSNFLMLVIALGVALNGICYTDGLKCFTCNYEIVNGLESGVRSCRSGKTPNEGLSEDCSQQSKMLTSLVYKDGLYISNKTVTADEFMSAKGVSTNQNQWACTKIVIHGEVPYNSTSTTLVSIEYTSRGCYLLKAKEEMSCKLNDAKGWQAGHVQEDPLSTFITEKTRDLRLVPNSALTACICNGENCNSALTQFSTSMSVLMVSVAVYSLNHLFYVD